MGPITEVELQPRLADMASRSILLNGLEDRMNVLNIDLADTLDFIEGGSAETVLCNPPYFLNSESSQKIRMNIWRLPGMKLRRI